MPRIRPLTDVELYKFARKAPFFRGVFMRDSLPKVPWENESGIVNLDEEANPGTHWVAYRKFGQKVVYFDSFGDLPPPLELQRYFVYCIIYFNYTSFQSYNTTFCGQLCIQFLYLNDVENMILRKL